MGTCGRRSKQSIKQQYIMEKTNIEHMPDQKWHKIISFIKSGIRILGYALIVVNIPAAVLILILSEVVGIIEELV